MSGVLSAGANSQVPFGDMHLSSRVARLGRNALAGREPTYTRVTADYFKTVGLPVIRGRDVTRLEESSGEQRVAIIDEPLARTLFPGEDPIGQQVWIPPREGAARDAENDPMAVVGVVPGLRDALSDAGAVGTRGSGKFLRVRVPVTHIVEPAGVAFEDFRLLCPAVGNV